MLEIKKDGKDQGLTQDTTWESNRNAINITNKSQEVSPFPAGDHKAEMNRRESMGNTRNKNTNDPPCELNYFRVETAAESMPNIWCQLNP